MNSILIANLMDSLFIIAILAMFLFPFFIALLIVLYRCMELRLYQQKERIDLSNYYKRRKLDCFLNNKTNKKLTKEDIVSLIDENMLSRLKESTYKHVMDDLNVQKSKNQIEYEKERFKLERAERRMKLDIDQIERKFGFICDQVVNDYVLGKYMRQGDDFKYVVDFGNTEETGRTRKQDIDEIYTQVRSIINDDMFFDDLSLIYDLNNYNMEEYLKVHYIKGLYNKLVDDLITIQKRNRILEHHRQAKIMYETRLAEEQWNSPEARAEREREEARQKQQRKLQERLKYLKENGYKTNSIREEIPENETMTQQTDRLLRKYKDKPYLHDLIRKEVKKAFKEKTKDESILNYSLSKALEYGITGHELDSENDTITQYIKDNEDELNNHYYRLLPKDIIDKYRISDEPYGSELDRMTEIRERKKALIREMKNNRDFQKRVEEAKYDRNFDAKSPYDIDEYLYKKNEENSTNNTQEMNYGDMVTLNIGNEE